MKAVILKLLFLLVVLKGYCSHDFQQNQSKKLARYILYDVNTGEGFNLKRDVYMRIAIFMKILAKNTADSWQLVLPPWTKQWHWTNEKYHISYEWSRFFDIESLHLYFPVIELDQYYIDLGDFVEEVYILQHFPEFYNWAAGDEMDWSDKWNITDCRDKQPYWKKADGTFQFFHGSKHIKARKVKCISFQGQSDYLVSVVTSTSARSIMFDRAEIPTHSTYGESEYWMCRRSMRFAKHLVQAADVFRASTLNSSDIQDGTVRPLDWREEVSNRSIRGGPYLGVHLRRKDFIQGRPKEVPSLEDSVAQIVKYLRKYNLTTVFVATDMPDEEYNYISESLNRLSLKPVRYSNVNNQFSDGELAIIDQIIASHAKFFVGTYESTFTFRIQEEREIMGFPVETTFNRFCPGSSGDCPLPTKWLIKYPHKNFLSAENSKGHFGIDEL